ncbi:kelch-like ECH-associated protein 1B [Physella acuta]|uniref:kelch-like ECH-associated protein 1B n=1 Tax=Physella acuta TaxID=109671 RepID=UPI0027DDA11F|nr:kelch-like ECH-associated protein 1B [Physella acuta]XP_059169912.1 kelch-like ECH-associated protein 1B [Physella acuta]XP_059169913.1 kelch-like ECH-associated protein 1B [Physella acuta]XP_059169914.1 kelch-like ECH-associated protein 1B [Physella acuta]
MASNYSHSPVWSTTSSMQPQPRGEQILHPGQLGQMTGNTCPQAGHSDTRIWEAYLRDQTTAACSRPMPLSVYMMRAPITSVSSDGSMHFTISKYADEALSAINQFRLEGSLCDIALRIQGEEIHAHKVILAACSDYFRGMFTRGMKESNASSVEILEPSLTAEILRELVNFAYTYEIHVTQDNVQSLLVSAIFLEMKHVVDACTLFMEQQLDPSNCIGFAYFAAAHGCCDLENKAKKYIREHFCEVIKYDEFLTLDVNDVICIIQKDELNVKCETEVFQAVVRWVEHDSEKRIGQLEDLLEKVRLTNLAPCFLEDQLEKCYIINQLPRCVKLLLDKLRSLKQHRTCSDKPRKPCKPLVIYVVGGFYRKVMDSLKCLECYNPCSKEWTRLNDLPNPRCGPGVTSLLGSVYVIGGSFKFRGENRDLASLDMYNPEENMWISKSPMRVARNRVGVAVLDNKIYAIGGSSGGEQHKSAERYDPVLDKWEPIKDMNSVRMSAGVAVVNRLLYAVGGFDGRTRLKSVECFHPEENQWQDVEPMNEARSGAGVVVMNGYIYAVGGFDGQNQLRTVERYNPKENKWEFVSSLLKARSGVGVAVINNKLFALGGYDGSDFLPCVEVYCPEKDVWECETVMLCERSGHGVAVERKPNVS